MTQPRNRPDPPDPDAGLWFLPGPDDEDGDDLPPLPRADQTPLIDLAAWRQAQGQCARDLAALTFRYGMLAERLRAVPSGWLQRLALTEAAGLSWWVGDRLPPDRLSLWLGLRVSGVAGDMLALQRAGWAVRRLVGGAGPLADRATGLPAFLGRGAGDCADMADLMDRAADLHPAVQAAILFHYWRMAGPGGPTTDTEAAVLAACTGALMGPQTTAFLPLALAGDGAFRAAGGVADRLSRWLTGAEAATRVALSLLDRLTLWDGRARAALTDLSGRTPPALVTAFADWPQLSASLAQSVTGASRASVQRNIDMMADRGLIREVTGQGRYRVWAARI